jgi:hypothetical protein
MIERFNRIPGIAWLILLAFVLPQLAEFLEKFYPTLAWSDDLAALLLIGARTATFVKENQAHLTTRVIKTEPIDPSDFDRELPPDMMPIRKVIDNEPERSPLDRFLLGT